MKLLHFQPTYAYHLITGDVNRLVFQNSKLSSQVIQMDMDRALELVTRNCDIHLCISEFCSHGPKFLEPMRHNPSLLKDLTILSICKGILMQIGMIDVRKTEIDLVEEMLQFRGQKVGATQIASN